MSCKREAYRVLPSFEVRDFRIESLTIAVQRDPLSGHLVCQARMRVPAVDGGQTIDVICDQRITEEHAYGSPLSLARCVEGALRDALLHELSEKLFMNGQHVRKPHPERE